MRQNFSDERSRSVRFSLNFGVGGCCRDHSMHFSYLGVFLVSVKPLATENAENKTTPKICKITVFPIRSHQKYFLFRVARVEKDRVGRSVRNFFGALKFWPWLVLSTHQMLNNSVAHPFQIILVSVSVASG